MENTSTVYTITLNPALDYVMNLKTLTKEDINRADSVELYYGGKGVNVSAVLSRLHAPTLALGFAGGFTGEKLCRMMEEDGIRNDFVMLDEGETRINVKLRYGAELDVNAAGPKVSEEKMNELLKKLAQIRYGDYLVLAGSVPKTMQEDSYERILEALSGKGVRFAVDATGKQLLNTLSREPFLIKPNHHELGEIFGRKLTSEDEIIRCAEELQTMGAQNVLVSRGKDGAVLVDEFHRVHCAEAVKGELVSSVGCGDSMVAGFLAGMMEKNDYEYAFRFSVAVSAATAFSKELAKAEDAKRIFQSMGGVYPAAFK